VVESHQEKPEQRGLSKEWTKSPDRKTMPPTLSAMHSKRIGGVKKERAKSSEQSSSAKKIVEYSPG